MRLRIRRVPGRVTTFAVLVLLILIVAGIRYLVSPLLDHYTLDALVEDLRSAGVTVEPSPFPEHDDEFFAVPPQIIVVNGSPIHTYQFADNPHAFQASWAVSPHGSSIAPTRKTGGVQIGWAIPVQWYRRGQLIVQAGGEKPETRAVLKNYWDNRLQAIERYGVPAPRR